jgi:hypothetical protein
MYIKNIDNKAFLIIVILIVMISILSALIFSFKKHKDEKIINPSQDTSKEKIIFQNSNDSLRKIYLNKDSINNFDSTDIIRYFNEY